MKTRLSLMLCLSCLAGHDLADKLLADERQPFSLGADPPAAAFSQPEETRPDQAVRILPLRRTQWLMFTADWCGACRSARTDFEPWLTQSHWIVNDTEAAHVRLIDGDRSPDLIRRYQIISYPTFVLLRDGQELSRSAGYPGRGELVRRFLAAVEAAPPLTGAVSAGTLRGQRDNIARMIDIFRPLLGTQGKLTMRLDRADTATAVLPLGDRLSIRADTPLVMTYELKHDVLTCRFEQPYPRGHFKFGLPVEQAISAVSLSVSEVMIELPRAPDVRLKVEP